MLKAKIFTLAALLVVLMLNISTVRAQVKPESEQPYILWEFAISDFKLPQINSCDFSPDESKVAMLLYEGYPGSGRKDYWYIYFFETMTGNLIDSLKNNDTNIYVIRFFNDSTVIVGADDKLRFYNIHTKQIVRENDYIKKDLVKWTI